MPALPPQLPLHELQERLQLAKSLFDQNVEKLRAEFDGVQQQAHELATCLAQATLTQPEELETIPPSKSTHEVEPGSISTGHVHHVHSELKEIPESAQKEPEQKAKREVGAQKSPRLMKTTSEFEDDAKPTSDNGSLWSVLPAVVIVVNALVIGISLDFYRGHFAWQILEYFFVIFYSLEFAAKVWVFGFRWYWCGPDRSWNAFDFACLVIMYVDASVATSLYVDGGAGGADGSQTVSGLNLMKIFRLARLARLVRALRFRVFYELKLIVLGVFSGLRVICWAILLLVVLVYAIGVAMRNFVGEEEEFESVLQAMFTCFRCFTEGCDSYNGTPLPERLREHYGGGYFVTGYIFVTMLINVGVFNLIMAVFIENVMSSQYVRKQNEISETALAMEMKIKDKIIRKLGLRRNSFRKSSDLKSRSEDMDWVLQAGGRSISREEFAFWLQDPDFIRLLDEASIDVSGRVALFDVLDADGGGELSVEELITGLMSLRGPVTKGDVIGINLKVRYLVRMIEAFQTDSLARPANLVESATF